MNVPHKPVSEMSDDELLAQARLWRTAAAEPKPERRLAKAPSAALKAARKRRRKPGPRAAEPEGDLALIVGEEETDAR